MNPGLRRLLLNEYVLVFLFCAGVLAGPASSTLLNYELHLRCTDCYAYKGVASFDFDQSPVRRYRILVPFAAAAINSVINKNIDNTAPDYFHGDFSLPVSFFIVNFFLVCCLGVVIYHYCRAHQVSIIASLIGLLVLLSCRWTAFLAAMPMVDSLYCLIIALCLLGIKTADNRLLALAIFLGPFAKESFVFFYPMIFFFGGIPKTRLMFYFLFAGLLVLSYRYLYEWWAQLPVYSGLEADYGQINYLRQYWAGLFSPKGAYKILTNTGIWILLPVIAAAKTEGYLTMLGKRLGKYLWLFMLAVLVHMLFGQYERHFYLAMPVICLVVALSLDLLLPYLSDCMKQKNVTG